MRYLRCQVEWLNRKSNKALSDCMYVYKDVKHYVKFAGLVIYVYIDELDPYYNFFVLDKFVERGVDSTTHMRIWHELGYATAFTNITNYVDSKIDSIHET